MWRCKKCHSTAVAGDGAIDLNSGIIIDDVEDMVNFQCDSCGSTEVYFKNEPDENDRSEFDEEDDDDDFWMYPDGGLPD